MTATMKVTNLQNESSATPNIVLNADGTTTIPTQSTTNLSYTGTLTGGTGVINIGSGQLVKDAAGNLGLGVTPSAWNTFTALQVKDISLASFTNGDTRLSSNAFYQSGWKYINTRPAVQYLQDSANGVHAWFTAPSGTAGNAIGFTQLMTLDGSGNLLVGLTSPQSGIGSDPAGVTIYGSGVASSLGASIFVRNNVNSVLYVNNKTVGACSLEIFYSGGNLVGEITSSGTGVSYGTASDYRLKENVQPMTGALAKVAALKPCTYTWKTDGSAGQGFIAHELQEVVPDCVTGEKDAVDADGNPKYQGVDTSFLVATLTAALQEQQAIITQLQADVAALKGAA